MHKNEHQGKRTATLCSWKDANITCDQGALAGKIGEATDDRTDLLVGFDSLHHFKPAAATQRRAGECTCYYDICGVQVQVHIDRKFLRSNV